MVFAEAEIPWHYWIALPLVAAGVLLLVALVIGYLRQVSSPRYPTRRQRT